MCSQDHYRNRAMNTARMKGTTMQVWFEVCSFRDAQNALQGSSQSLAG